MATGIDTNVLLELLVRRDVGALTERAAHAVGEAEKPIRIADIVLAEAVWVMERTYRFDRSGIVNFLDELLALPDVTFADRTAVEVALGRYREGGPGFADHLIGISNARAGCGTTLAFDKAAARAEGFRQA